MEKIKLSIITINLNNAAGLEKTMASVARQVNRNFEWIVIDGGSADGSIDIINKYSGLINYLVSEKDNGVYHAMNKGIALAKGDYCYFLNSGDYLSGNHALDVLTGDSLSGDIVNFNSLVEDGDKQTPVKSPAEISFYFFYKHSILHQATFIKRKLFSDYGLYNENFKMVSDWEFFIKALFLHQCTYQSVPLTLSVFDANGYSSKPENYTLGLNERKLVLEKYFPGFLRDYRLLEPPVYKYLETMNRFTLLRALLKLRARIINKLFKRR